MCKYSATGSFHRSLASWDAASPKSPQTKVLTLTVSRHAGQGRISCFLRSHCFPTAEIDSFWMFSLLYFYSIPLWKHNPVNIPTQPHRCLRCLPRLNAKQVGLLRPNPHRIGAIISFGEMLPPAFSSTRIKR